MNGEGFRHPDPQGRRIVDDSFYLLFNASHEPVTFTLPDRKWSERWIKMLDTRDARPKKGHWALKAGHQVHVEANSLIVLQKVT